MKKIICLMITLCALCVLFAVPASAQQIAKPINIYKDTILVLDNAVYRGNEPAIAVHNDAKLTLVLKGNSVIERETNGNVGMYSAIFMNDQSQLMIVNDPGEEKKGSLELKNWDFGICANDTGKESSIQVEGVNLMIDSTLGGICNMNGNVDEISIRDANVSVKNTELVGIGSYFGGDLKKLSIENSNVSVDSGFVGIGSDQAAVKNISINNSKFKVNSKLAGIGGRDADISQMTISNSTGIVKVMGNSDLPYVGIGMATGVAGGLSGNGQVRIYTIKELALKNNILLVDSPVICIGAARKESGETGTSIANMTIQGGYLFTKTRSKNGLCVGANGLNIDNIRIQNGCLLAKSEGTVIGCAENENLQGSPSADKPTSIMIGGQARVIAAGGRIFAPRRNILHLDDTVLFASAMQPDQGNRTWLEENNGWALAEGDVDYHSKWAPLYGVKQKQEMALSLSDERPEPVQACAVWKAFPRNAQGKSMVKPLSEAQLNGAMKDLQKALDLMNEQNRAFVEAIEDLHELFDGGQLNNSENLELVPDFFEKTLPIAFIVPAEEREIPKTGDQTNLPLLLASTVISLAVIVFLAKKKRA